MDDLKIREELKLKRVWSSHERWLAIQDMIAIIEEN